MRWKWEYPSFKSWLHHCYSTLVMWATTLGLHYFSLELRTKATYHFIKKKNKKYKGRESKTAPPSHPPRGFSQYIMLENKLGKHNQQPQTTKDLGMIQDQRPSKELM